MSGLHPAPVRVPGRGQDREGACEGRAAEGVHPLQRPHRRLPREPQPRHHTRGRRQGEQVISNELVLVFCANIFRTNIFLLFKYLSVYISKLNSQAGSRNEGHDNAGVSHALRVASGLATKKNTAFGIVRNLQQVITKK